MRTTIDINCDMGEGYPFDEVIMPFISSANISCGAHAGDAASIRHTIELCKQHGVAAGAHPSFPDKENFGRLKMTLTEEELMNTIEEQVFLFQRIAEQCGTKMHHIKLHGALYNLAANDASITEIILEAIRDCGNEVLLYGLSGSLFNRIARSKGFTVIDEVFADRTYQADGSLTPRSMPAALIEEDDKALAQVIKMIAEEKVYALTGEEISIAAGTICIHGDGKHAVEFASLIHHELMNRNILIQSPGL